MIDTLVLPTVTWGTVTPGEFKDRAQCISSTGRIYGKSYWSYKKAWDVFWLARDETKQLAVRCDCGSETFTLHYGDYEMIAVCSVCDARGVVYSG